MSKVVNSEKVKSLLKDGMTIMIGGFLGCGTAHSVIDLIVESGVKDLTVISNDTTYINQGVGKLLASGQLKKLVASYIGGNADTGRLMNEGKLEVELVPQGTLAERIRCAGAGIGGFLTPTGVGTMVQDGKQVLNVEGKEYLLELPLRADLALIKANIADEFGNVVYRGTTRNFNQVMAMAADTVVVEAENVVNIGEVNPEHIGTPGVLVDYVMKEAK